MSSSIADSQRLARNRFADSSDDDDEEERLLEEEHERLLSEQHGEAEEAPSSSSTNKRGQTEQEIEAEYGSTRRKKPRPTLTPAALIGPKGLIRIRCEFSKQVRWPSHKNKVDAAAAYSRSLVKAYKSFCYDLFPGSAFEDMCTRIESFGSKKEVKTYLQGMRDDVRNNHLERLYGKEKANRLIQELQEGLKQEQEEEEMEYDDVNVPADAMGVDGNSGMADGNDNVRTDETVRTTRAQVASATTTAEETTTTTSAVNNDSNAVEANKAESDAEQEFDDLQDTDDELDIVAPRKATNPAGPTTTTSNPFESDNEDEHQDKVSGEMPMETDVGLKADETSDGTAAEANTDAEQDNSDSSGLVNGVAEEKEASEATTQVDSAEVLTEGEGVERNEKVSQEKEPHSEEETSNQEVEQAKPSSDTSPPVALTSDEPARLVPTMSTMEVETTEGGEAKGVDETSNESKEKSTPRDENQVPELSHPDRDSDETATIVPTMSSVETQLESSQEGETLEVDGASSEAAAQEDLSSSPKETSSPESSALYGGEDELTSDETATLVPTMSTLLESPQQEEQDAAVSMAIEEVHQSPMTGTQLSETATLIPTMTATSQQDPESTSESP